MWLRRKICWRICITSCIVLFILLIIVGAACFC
ncbi:hypothetical protein COL61_14205 [Bacillus wiedmannii]|nr:hypothetical protein COL61_14205 [Bacillus wiedmannii]